MNGSEINLSLKAGLGLDSLKFRSRPIAKKGSLLGIRFEMCAYAGGLYAETFALIVDVTIVLFSVFLCTHLKACLALYVKDRHYILWRSLEFTYALAEPTSLVCLLFGAY
ncbi:hypothetical protein OIU85_021673 [Salix viminalis]|uniref:Uncharacterized protein n=1 Tax=Salix viminalis TaxID=40686 RepID=A0A9Q0UJ76_SALVM|nr:hypothetical protein OIU85_021673 [Salix viminalis]